MKISKHTRQITVIILKNKTESRIILITHTKKQKFIPHQQMIQLNEKKLLKRKILFSLNIPSAFDAPRRKFFLTSGRTD